MLKVGIKYRPLLVIFLIIDLVIKKISKSRPKRFDTDLTMHTYCTWYQDFGESNATCDNHPLKIHPLCTYFMYWHIERQSLTLGHLIPIKLGGGSLFYILMTFQT